MKIDSGGQWWTRSWDCVRGCSPVGDGCERCWAARMAARFSRPAGQRLDLNKGERRFRNISAGPFHGMAEFDLDGRPAWTGRVELVESMLEAPLHWRKPAVIAVSLMGDWCHENLPDEARDRIFAVMALCPQHTFILLTKRWEGQAQYFGDALGRADGVAFAVRRLRQVMGDHGTGRLLPHLSGGVYWRPLPNVILGASAWDQASTDEACRWLLQTPAAKRLLCLEPLIAPVDVKAYLPPNDPCLDWVIVGGET